MITIGVTGTGQVVTIPGGYVLVADNSSANSATTRKPKDRRPSTPENRRRRG